MTVAAGGRLRRPGGINIDASPHPEGGGPWGNHGFPHALLVVAAEDDPHGGHGLVAVVVQPVRDARFEGDGIARLEEVILEPDGDAESAAQDGAELAAVVTHELSFGAGRAADVVGREEELD